MFAIRASHSEPQLITQAAAIIRSRTRNGSLLTSDVALRIVAPSRYPKALLLFWNPHAGVLSYESDEDWRGLRCAIKTPYVATIIRPGIQSAGGAAAVGAVCACFVEPSMKIISPLRSKDGTSKYRHPPRTS